MEVGVGGPGGKLGYFAEQSPPQEWAIDELIRAFTHEVAESPEEAVKILDRNHGIYEEKPLRIWLLLDYKPLWTVPYEG